MFLEYSNLKNLIELLSDWCEEYNERMELQGVLLLDKPLDILLVIWFSKVPKSLYKYIVRLSWEKNYEIRDLRV